MQLTHLSLSPVKGKFSDYTMTETRFPAPDLDGYALLPFTKEPSPDTLDLHTAPSRWRGPNNSATVNTATNVLHTWNDNPNYQYDAPPYAFTREKLCHGVWKMAKQYHPLIRERLCHLWSPEAALAFTDDDQIEMLHLAMAMLHHTSYTEDPTMLRGIAANDPGEKRILFMWDTPGIVAYHACLYPDKEFLHVALSIRLSNSIDRVCSLAIQSLRPQDTIADDLRHLHNVLRPGGVCQLTLINPMPVMSTVGRRLVLWLERHLLRNLTREGKCLSPTSWFPDFLRRAGLRGPGSTVTRHSFRAVSHVKESTTDIISDNPAEVLQREQHLLPQVQSLVGRTLWIEIWGPYVTAEKWWWEERDIVDECLSLGTEWEYHLINAVKDSHSAD
ncbi:hypothetical protein B0I35DRAFT_440031 [Stachybotrys elegans]|uniref:Uncharacterized protein n=1 Tax=Stachybotrys elegans TaxID=80388 RepID=A0A8K0WNH3_9HYPO|nr:hypothetical protein B0I35DRAFT_440031 [Stachybotrys elegans]